MFAFLVIHWVYHSLSFFWYFCLSDFFLSGFSNAQLLAFLLFILISLLITSSSWLQMRYTVISSFHIQSWSVFWTSELCFQLTTSLLGFLTWTSSLIYPNSRILLFPFPNQVKPIQTKQIHRSGKKISILSQPRQLQLLLLFSYWVIYDSLQAHGL